MNSKHQNYFQNNSNKEINEIKKMQDLKKKFNKSTEIL
jgi:hypothetical protein